MDSSRRTIASKDLVLRSLNKELERIEDEFKKENEKCKVEFLVSHTKDEQTIKRLQDELKHRPEVLDIPPLETVMGQEATLMAEVEKKNRLIERMKAQFENILAEIHNKHQLEINEYRKKEENMKNIIAKKDEELKGKTVEPEMITAERYDVSAHQQALIRYESSLQNREKALDVAFKEIEAHEKVKKGLQSYRAFLRTREKSLMDVIAAMNAGADLSAWSTTNETFKKKIAEKEDEIKELKKKLLEDRESKHLGCKSEIEDLKSQIATLKKNSILQRVGIVYTPDITDLRAKELETEAEQLRKKMSHVQSQLRHANECLQQKEKEHEEKNKKNVQMMKKYIEDKDRLNESLIKCATKVKELERKLEHAPVAASQEPEASRQGKRLECTNLSSLEGDLQPKPPKQARTME